MHFNDNNDRYNYDNNDPIGRVKQRMESDPAPPIPIPAQPHQGHAEEQAEDLGEATAPAESPSEQPPAEEEPAERHEEPSEPLPAEEAGPPGPIPPSAEPPEEELDLSILGKVKLILQYFITSLVSVQVVACISTPSDY